MKSLTREETREALQSYGLDHPTGVGFAFLDRVQNTFYDWHSHEYHQLLYAIDGPTQIETASGRHVLPVGRAAWIPAGTGHRTVVTQARCASLYFSPLAVADPAGRVRILVANPLMREMIVYATRWPLGTSEVDPLAESFLRALGLLCSDWLEAELPLFLPSATHPSIRRAMDYAMADLANATQAGAMKAAAMSERSFRRSFGWEAGVGWQAWLAQARILMAMGLLSDGRRVTDAAADVGYASLSAFAQAFARIAGEPPAQFRLRSRLSRGRHGDGQVPVATRKRSTPARQSAIET